MQIINEIPCWYLILALLWILYQAYRGVREHALYHEEAKKSNQRSDWSCKDEWVILYIHDFVFRFVCTMAGFSTLFFTYYILSKTTDLMSISTGTSALVASAFIIGVIGVGGQLHHVILLGKTK
jgi:hypothetical protein